MARFSKRTLRILGDEFAGSWTLATISDLFDDAGIELGDTSTANGASGQRRGLATQYLSTLNLDSPADTAKLVDVFNHVLFEMTHRPPWRPPTTSTSLPPAALGTGQHDPAPQRQRL